LSNDEENLDPQVLELAPSMSVLHSHANAYDKHLAKVLQAKKKGKISELRKTLLDTSDTRSSEENWYESGFRDQRDRRETQADAAVFPVSRASTLQQDVPQDEEAQTVDPQEPEFRDLDGQCPRDFIGPMCDVPTCPCSGNGACRIDNQGYPACSCLPSFKGKDCAKPICSQDYCENGGQCTIETLPTYQRLCKCRDGFGGSTCQVIVPTTRATSTFSKSNQI